MPSWQDLVRLYGSSGFELDGLLARLTAELHRIAVLRDDRMVIYYGSAFLQHPELPNIHLSIMHEDINGYMSCVHEMDFSKGLTLVLHTPGGSPNAAETIVKFLRSKFDDIEVIVPAFAMSAGTMVALAADRVIMGRQSQLGPIDPQMRTAHGTVSAHAVIDQFAWAKAEVAEDPGTVSVWAPVLAAHGPSLLSEAKNALNYGAALVTEWLQKWMFAGDHDASSKALSVANYLSDASQHGSHGRRVDRDEASQLGLVVEELEKSQDLQDAVLTAYHAMTILFENTGISKLILSSTDRNWLKGRTPRDSTTD